MFLTSVQNGNIWHKDAGGQNNTCVTDLLQHQANWDFMSAIRSCHFFF